MWGRRRHVPGPSGGAACASRPGEGRRNGETAADDRTVPPRLPGHPDPHHQRPAAPEARLGIAPALFFMGLGPPAPPAESVLQLGSTRLRGGSR
ncbi:hypothetical protein [Streptomyces xanthophaeus]